MQSCVVFIGLVVLVLGVTVRRFPLSYRKTVPPIQHYISLYYTVPACDRLISVGELKNVHQKVKCYQTAVRYEYFNFAHRQNEQLKSNTVTKICKNRINGIAVAFKNRS